MSDAATGNTTAINGATIHYAAWGRPGRPPVVLLHGLRAYGQWFTSLGAALKERYYVVAPDLRGRNLSDWAKDGDYSIDAYAADLTGLARQLGFSRFALGGHSLGGAVAASYASRFPDQVAALILFDASPEPDLRGIQRIKAEVAATPASFTSWDAARDYLRGLHPRAPAEDFATRLQCMLKESDDGTLRWRIDPRCTTTALGPPEKSWAALRALQCPVLLLRGAQSDILNPETCAKMLAAIPSGQAVEIERAAHMVLEDNPEATVSASRAFLAAHYPAGG